MSIDIRFPKIQSHWPNNSLNFFTEQANRLKEIAAGVNVNSTSFKERKLKLITALETNNGRLFLDLLKEKRFFSVFSSLCSQSKPFLKKLPIAPELFKYFEEIHPSPSILALTNLIRSYFDSYSTLLDHGQTSRNAYADYIKSAIKIRLKDKRHSTRKSSLSKIFQNADILFSPNASQKIAQDAINRQLSLEKILEEYGVSKEYSQGDFLAECRLFYYLEMLRTIPLGEYHPVLKEIYTHRQKPLYVNGPQLGHAALRILISRSLKEGISQTWLNSVLEIAGDPRISQRTQNYVYWWAHIDQKLIEAVKGWLSQLDLRLFLKLLQDSARHNSDMRRMFPARKKFIEGLLEDNLITSTRLFLSRSAQVIFQNSDEIAAEHIKFAQVGSGQTSFIYMNLQNKVHVMEGTHSCRLRMRTFLEKNASYTNYDRTYFSEQECKEYFVDRIQAKYDPCLFSQNHCSRWQHPAIEFLKKQGIPVNAASVLSTEEFRFYKAFYGTGGW